MAFPMLPALKSFLTLCPVQPSLSLLLGTLVSMVSIQEPQCSAATVSRAPRLGTVSLSILQCRCGFLFECWGAFRIAPVSLNCLITDPLFTRGRKTEG